jgi:hypothetical protein
MADADPTGNYCEYLDKEMTIMGLLSAFSVAVPAAVLDRAGGAKPGDNNVLLAIWSNEKLLLTAGSTAFFLAALAFYLQRSHLAFCYGQLRFSQTTARYPNLTEKNLLRDADSWATWRAYRVGFILLPLGFLLYGVMLLHEPKASSEWQAATVLDLGVPATVYLLADWRVKFVAEYSDHPWWLYARRLRRLAQAFRARDAGWVWRSLRKL